jgi:hypothetical protein
MKVASDIALRGHPGRALGASRLALSRCSWRRAKSAVSARRSPLCLCSELKQG